MIHTIATECSQMSTADSGGSLSAAPSLRSGLKRNQGNPSFASTIASAKPSAIINANFNLSGIGRRSSSASLRRSSHLAKRLLRFAAATACASVFVAPRSPSNRLRGFFSGQLLCASFPCCAFNMGALVKWNQKMGRKRQCIM